MAPPKRKNKKCLECNHVFRRFKREPTYDAKNPYRQVCPKCGASLKYGKIIGYREKK